MKLAKKHPVQLCANHQKKRTQPDKHHGWLRDQVRKPRISPLFNIGYFSRGSASLDFDAWNNKRSCTWVQWPREAIYAYSLLTAYLAINSKRWATRWDLKATNVRFGQELNEVKLWSRKALCADPFGHRLFKFTNTPSVSIYCPKGN